MSEPLTPPPLPPQQPHYSAPKPVGEDAGMRMLLPVGRSGWAIAAGYCGLFAFVFIGAPFALIFGILAIRDIKKSKSEGAPKYGMGRAIFGIIIGTIMTALLIVGITAALLG